jgi:hypothetical protein
VKDKYVANTFHEGLIPQDHFLDTVRDHAKRVGLAGKMASCRDKEKAKLKFLRSYFGSAMPHDSTGGFPMTEYVLKNVGVESREKMSDLKLYTDALGARTLLRSRRVLSRRKPSLLCLRLKSAKQGCSYPRDVLPKQSTASAGSPPDREPQTGHQELDTGPGTAQQ